MFFRPAIEIHEGYFSVGKRVVPWMDVRRLDILRLDRYGLGFAASDTGNAIRRYALHAYLSGRNSRPAAACCATFAGCLAMRSSMGFHIANIGAKCSRRAAAIRFPGLRYRILRPEDEAEVERLYQRLKSVGHLDQKNSTDEK